MSGFSFITAQQFQEILLRHVLAWQGPWSFLCNLKRPFESSFITFVNIIDNLLGTLLAGLFVAIMYLGIILNKPLMTTPHIKSFCLFCFVVLSCSSMHGYKLYCFLCMAADSLFCMGWRQWYFLMSFSCISICGLLGL